MSRSAIAAYVQNANEGMSKKQAEATVDAVFEGLLNEMQSNGRVQIADFGTFAVKEQGERQARNPKTGESITVPPKKVAKFKAAKKLAEKIDS